MDKNLGEKRGVKRVCTSFYRCYESCKNVAYKKGFVEKERTFYCTRVCDLVSDKENLEKPAKVG